MNLINTASKSFIRMNSTYVNPNFINRNPRNLEKMRIARKPVGYHLDKPGRSFWHKLILTTSNRAITAQLVHHQNGTIIEVKSSEWPLKKQLFNVKDTSAYINLGRVFAQRCLEAGITEMYFNGNFVEGSKLEKLVTEIKNSGIVLEEPEQYVKPKSVDKDRPEKPWEVTEE